MRFANLDFSFHRGLNRRFILRKNTGSSSRTERQKGGGRGHPHPWDASDLFIVTGVIPGYRSGDSERTGFAASGHPGRLAAGELKNRENFPQPISELLPNPPCQACRGVR